MASAGPHRTHNNATSQSLQGQIASKDSKIQELRRNITQLTEENAELKEDKRSLREYNDHLKKDFENLRRDLERERDENAKLRRHITEESKEDEGTSRQVKELRSQVQVSPFSIPACYAYLVPADRVSSQHRSRRQRGLVHMTNVSWLWYTCFLSILCCRHR
jgi:DNA repair exonuclease SbcCD ATPase subunit